MKDHEAHPPVFIDRGQGIYLYDREGRSYIDAVSSWWVNLFGHTNPRIIRAVGEQLTRLEHVIFAGFTHAPAEELADRLFPLVPPGLSHLFFANDGTCAVEAALKMSHASWRNLGAPEKCRFLYLSNSYHGETMSKRSATSSSRLAGSKRWTSTPRGNSRSLAGSSPFSINSRPVSREGM